MSELLFDRPFNSTEQSNKINHHLSEEVQQVRGDAVVLCEVAKLKTAFLQQNDCLCHGDLATDNVMVTEGEFRVRLIGTGVRGGRRREEGRERSLPKANCTEILFIVRKFCVVVVIVISHPTVITDH